MAMADYWDRQFEHDRGEFKFEKRDDGMQHCTWCGSLTVVDATRLLNTPGERFSGSDWKYGYPHKFYLGNAHNKFYTKHLSGATPDEFEAFAKAALKLLGIRFSVDEKGVKYIVDVSELTPGVEVNRMYGFQAWGTVPA